MMRTVNAFPRCHQVISELLMQRVTHSRQKKVVGLEFMTRNVRELVKGLHKTVYYGWLRHP